MRRITPRLLIVLLAILLAVTSAGVWAISRPSLQKAIRQPGFATQIEARQEATAVAPAARWEPVFFGIINERVAEAKIPNLRTALLPDGAFEIRVWVGFGIRGEDGFSLQHSSGQWSALHLHGMAERPPFVKTLRSLPAPRSGWEAAWKKLVEAGVLRLPDASDVGCNTHIFDGTSYVVEINLNKTYRTYLYDNPKYARCDEAKHMIRIGEIITEEFGLKEFKIRD